MNAHNRHAKLHNIDPLWSYRPLKKEERGMNASLNKKVKRKKITLKFLKSRYVVVSVVYLVREHIHKLK